MERKNCPYCGEDIAMLAKKCRFCGEWLDNNVPQPVRRENPRGYATPEPVQAEVSVVGENNQPLVEQQRMYPSHQPNQAAGVMSNQQPNQGLQQNIVVQPQIIVENRQEVEVNQQQEVKVVVYKESESGCLWTQLIILSIGLGFAFHGFWYGVAALIILGTMLFIPFLGQALCVIFGIAFGIMAAGIASTFGAATWIVWLVGIFVGAGLIYGNLEQRKTEIADD